MFTIFPIVFPLLSDLFFSALRFILLFFFLQISNIKKSSTIFVAQLCWNKFSCIVNKNYILRIATFPALSRSLSPFFCCFPFFFVALFDSWNPFIRFSFAAQKVFCNCCIVVISNGKWDQHQRQYQCSLMSRVTYFQIRIK